MKISATCFLVKICLSVVPVFNILISGFNIDSIFKTKSRILLYTFKNSMPSFEYEFSISLKKFDFPL